MVKNTPSKAGDPGLIPGWGTKIPYAEGQLNPSSTTPKAVCSGVPTPQPGRNPHTAMKFSLVATETGPN